MTFCTMTPAFATLNHYAKCHFAECHYAEFFCTEFHHYVECCYRMSVILLDIAVRSVIGLSGFYAKCHGARTRLSKLVWK